MVEVAVGLECDVSVVLRREPPRQVEPVVLRPLRAMKRFMGTDDVRQNRPPPQFVLLVE